MAEPEADVVRNLEPGQQPRLLKDDTIFWFGAVMRSPSSTIVPSLAGSSPPMVRSSVDFPQPEPPITATISPGSTSSETPPSACTPLG